MKSKERFCYVFAICLLLLVIGVLIFLYFSGRLYASNISQVSNIPINSSVFIKVNENEASAISFDISGGLIPGEKIPENINISNQSEDELYLRSKAFVYTAEYGLVGISLEVNQNWELKDDGYYYFIGTIQPNQTIGLASQMILNNEYSLSNKQRYIINVIVETLKKTQNMCDIWHNNIE